MAYPIISADSHITEPPNTYVDFIDSAWRDRAPRMERVDGRGDVFVVDGMKRPIDIGLAAAAGKPPEELRVNGIPFEELHRGGWDPEARIGDQARDGVAAEVIYPTVGMVLCNHRDFDYKKACFDAYNRWIARLLLRAPGAAARRRPDRAALARGRHRGPARDQAPRPARRDDARQSRGRGLRLEDLRRVLGDRDRSRAAALVPHPDRARERTGARAEDERLPLDHPRLPGHHGHARARRRVRAPPAPACRVRRGRRRLGAPLHVPHGPRLQAPPLLAARRPGALEAARPSTSASTSTPRSRTTSSRSRPPIR